MDLLDVLLVDGGLEGGDGPEPPGGESSRALVLQVLLEEPDEGVAFEVAGGTDEQVSGGELGVVDVGHLVAVEGPHRLGGAEDRPAQRGVPPEVLPEQFVDDLVG